LLSGRKLGQVCCKEVVNTHAEAATTHEAKLQAEIAAAHEIQRVKEVMARQA
jgi:hypothetical protein